MKRHGRILVATLAVCLAASMFAAPVRAEGDAKEPIRKPDLGFSVGAGAGVASFDKFEDDTFAWRVQAAYSPCKWVAGEIEWLDLGSPRKNFTTGGKLEMAAAGFNLSIVPTLPIGEDLALFGKLGGYFWDANYAGVSGGNWSTDMSFGLGASYRLFPSFGAGVKAEWTRVMLEVGSVGNGPSASLEDNADVFTLGAYFLF